MVHEELIFFMFQMASLASCYCLILINQAIAVIMEKATYRST